jgi:hypothetical protein
MYVLVSDYVRPRGNAIGPLMGQSAAAPATVTGEFCPYPLAYAGKGGKAWGIPRIRKPGNLPTHERTGGRGVSHRA